MEHQVYVLKFAAAFVLLLAVAPFRNVVARAAPCKDISTVWTLNSMYVDNVTVSRMFSDGIDYSDGSRGVAATIKSCSTNDAVLTVGGDRRLMFNFFGASLSTNLSTPAWTNDPSRNPFGSTPSTVKNCSGSPCTLLNVRNILNSGTAPRNQNYRLYTRLLSAFVAPDGKSYHMYMLNPYSDITTPDYATSNSPYLNARVVVDHYPAANGNQEYWLVYPEAPTSTDSQSPSPENGTLFSDDRTVNFGEFSMPFYINISVK